MIDKKQLKQEYNAMNNGVPIEHREGFKSYISRIKFSENTNE